MGRQGAMSTHGASTPTPWVWILYYAFSMVRLPLPFPIQRPHVSLRLCVVVLLCVLFLGVLISTMDTPLVDAVNLGSSNNIDTKPGGTYDEGGLKKVTNPIEIFSESKGDLFMKYQLNVTHSNALPLDRKIPDTRPELCKHVTYHVDTLPSASIIIPFHNEAWSVLLRTIVSIMNRTPTRILKEILLVDDASDFPYLKEPLTKYLEQFGDKRIKVIRKAKREGLIVARMLGARQARGSVLVFLDAHVEVNVQWLEPLLSAIKADPRVIAVPNIDDIQVENLDYVRWQLSRAGGFQWTLNYQWKHSPADDAAMNQWKHSPADDAAMKDTDQVSKPFPTATTIGCAMAIQRSYFFEIGAYDEGMLIWGGENLEISFRNWMCGGSVYVFPCSRVGHVFRRYLPYVFPPQYGKVAVIKKNLQRVAEVWMDDYKKYYYAAIHNRQPFSIFEKASLDKRKDLRKRLKCKSFSWYLEHVLPDLPVPKGNPKYHGQLRSALINQCLYRVDQPGENFHLGNCYAYDKNNTFSLTGKHSIVMPTGECLIHDEAGTRLSYGQCEDVLKKGTWAFDIENVNNFKVSFPDGIEDLPLGQVVFSNRWGTACLAASKDAPYPYFMDCNPESIRQFWYFTYEFKYQYA